ncbi:30S ribosome-binding factor RbfA [Candidatus Peregrinibacteria bacterium]|nr:30S ribosome-binding factor RbfA [Candidatus Peregrinibacteria bacterium]
MSTRTKKFENVIHREVSQFFAEVIDESEYGLVTIIKVEISPDLLNANIFVSVLENAEEFMTILKKRTPFIQRRIAPRLQFKKMPHFHFVLDTSQKHIHRIEKLLKLSDSEDSPE